MFFHDGACNFYSKLQRRKQGFGVIQPTVTDFQRFADLLLRRKD
jgi:hypothetical protein